jgi:RNA polymerase sigma factor FliA
MENSDVELWVEYIGSRETKQRNALVERYFPLVRHIAKRVDAIDFSGALLSIDERVSDGLLGLMYAIEKFNLDEDCEFATFAAPRIRGAILDGTRRRQPSYGVSRFVSRVGAFVTDFIQERGYYPSDLEIRGGLNISDLAWKNFSGANALVCPKSLSSRDNSKESPSQLSERVDLPDHYVDPSITMENRELYRVVEKMLSPKEKKVVELYHFDGLNMKEVGERIGLTESRVSQIYSGLVDRIREKIDAFTR